MNDPESTPRSPTGPETDLDSLHIELRDTPESAELAPLYEGLTEHALPFTGHPGFKGIAFFAHTSEGRLVGGVYGYISWNWLEVALLWVHPDLRSCGLGGRLLRDLEALGRERGCAHAQVDTFSFQALDFYLHQGYEIFAELEDYPPGHRRCYLRKDLEPSHS